MKMISSTSTTSTSGVMLISDCSVFSESPLNCMISVSLRLVPGALGDQPHAMEAGRLDGEHGLPDLVEMKACVGFDHDLGVGLVPHRGPQAFAELAGRDRLIADPQPAGFVDGDQNLAPLIALLRRLRR